MSVSKASVRRRRRLERFHQLRLTDAHGRHQSASIKNAVESAKLVDLQKQLESSVNEYLQSNSAFDPILHLYRISEMGDLEASIGHQRQVADDSARDLEQSDRKLQKNRKRVRAVQELRDRDERELVRSGSRMEWLSMPHFESVAEWGEGGW